MYQREFTVEQCFPRDRAAVFAFFGDAHNLDAITPPWLRFRILTPAPIAMKVGTRIDYRLRLHGVPVRWQSEITVWEPPLRFVDEQRHGPYRLWRHEHFFEEYTGGTRVRDCVTYALYGGWLAPGIDRWFVQRDLHTIFAYRQAKLAELFSEPPA